MQRIEEILPRVFTVIDKKLRHAYYDRTVEVAEKAYAFKTGDGLEKYLKPFALSETEEEFKASLDVTRLTAPIVVGGIIGVWSKIPRSRFKRVLEFEGDEDESRKKALEERLTLFWGDKGNVDQFCDVRYWELNAVDPNAWVITEFSDFAPGEMSKPYPFEVPAANAVDFLEDENELQFVNTLQYFVLKTDENGGTKNGEKYTIYGQDQTFTVTEIYVAEWNAMHPDLQVQPRKSETYQYDPVTDSEFPNGGGFLYSQGRVFVVRFMLPHNLGFVPASRPGFLRDDTTNGNTFLCLFDRAYPVLEGAMVTERQRALVAAYSAFPHRSEFTPPCDAPGCLNGKTANGENCGTCHGTGVKEVTSHAHVRRLPMPQSSSDLVVPLSEMIAFNGPDVAILEWMSSYIKELQDRAIEAQFQSDIFSKQEIAVTATEKNISLQNVYDQLFVGAQASSVFWSHLVWTVAGFTVTTKGLNAEKTYGRDFRFKAVIDLLAELEAAQRANAGPLVTRPLMLQIIEAVNDGDQSAINEYKLIEQLNPFAGKSDGDIMSALNSPYVPERLKFRYQNLSYIVDRVSRQLEGLVMERINVERLEQMADAVVIELQDEVRQDKPILTNSVTN